MKKYFIATLLSLALIPGLGMAGPKGNPAEIEAAMNRWVQELGEKEPEDVVALYHEHAILLATLESEPLFSKEQRIQYFKTLMAKPDFKAVINSHNVRMLNKDTASLTGLYTFSYKNEEGETVELPARFSFLYKKMHGQWVIIEHHSSLIPEAPL